jgi:phosphatidylserine/phosphatidylglycerophosphate/cardiolipin synthase-like enzyme
MPAGSPSPATVRLVLNEATYREVLLGLVAEAQRVLWLVTADIKDLHLEDGGRFVPFLKVLADKLKQGVEVRLVHAKEPGPRFREDFDRFPELVEAEGFERILCPRMHMKCVIADGRRAYIGSANLTGAGMGAKSPHRRNFEAGVVTEDRGMIQELMAFLDGFYLGDHCLKCQRRDVCPDPIA